MKNKEKELKIKLKVKLEDIIILAESMIEVTKEIYKLNKLLDKDI